MIAVKFSELDKGSDRKFDDNAKALIWAQDERNFWSDLLAQIGAGDGHPALEIRNAWNQATDDIDLFRRANNDSSENFTVSGSKLVLHDFPIGRALFYIFRRLPAEAAEGASRAAAVTNGDIEWQKPAQFQGAILYDRILKIAQSHSEEASNAKSEGAIASLEERVSALTASLSSIESAVSAVNDLSKLKISEIGAQISTIEARSTELVEILHVYTARLDEQLGAAAVQAQQGVQSAISQADDEVKRWLAARDEQIKLEAPATLWNDRSITHTSAAAKWRKYAAVTAGVGFLGALAVALASFCASQNLFESAISGGVSVVKPGTLRPTLHFELLLSGSFTLAYLTMYLWVIRIMVRLYTTEHHLAIDASARSAMSQTYLSLIESGAAGVEDRAIVLGAIFRPVQDGMVKDDGPPIISPAAAIAALGAGQSR